MRINPLIFNPPSDVYRYLLQHNRQNGVHLKNEIDFIKAYIFLVKIRFEDNFSITINIPEKFLATYIPPVSLQMLVENAIKHNIVSSDRPLHVDIYIQDDFIAVRNNIQLRRAVVDSGGIGLVSISTRYRLLSGQEIEISSDNGFFTLRPFIASVRVFCHYVTARLLRGKTDLFLILTRSRAFELDLKTIMNFLSQETIGIPYFEAVDKAKSLQLGRRPAKFFLKRIREM